MNENNLLRTGNRILDTSTGMVYERIAVNVVHVYRVSDCNRGTAATYVKYKDNDAKELWRHVSNLALLLV